MLELKAPEGPLVGTLLRGGTRLEVGASLHLPGLCPGAGGRHLQGGCCLAEVQSQLACMLVAAAGHRAGWQLHSSRVGTRHC